MEKKIIDILVRQNCEIKIRFDAVIGKTVVEGSFFYEEKEYAIPAHALENFESLDKVADTFLNVIHCFFRKNGIKNWLNHTMKGEELVYAV